MKYLNVLQLCFQGAQIKVQKERHLSIKTEPKVFFNICSFIFRRRDQEKRYKSNLHNNKLSQTLSSG